MEAHVLPFNEFYETLGIDAFDLFEIVKKKYEKCALIDFPTDANKLRYYIAEKNLTEEEKKIVELIAETLKRAIADADPNPIDAVKNLDLPVKVKVFDISEYDNAFLVIFHN